MGAARGNKNAQRADRPPQSRLDAYEAALRAGEITRDELAAQLGCSRSTTFAWIPGIGDRRPGCFARSSKPTRKLARKLPPVMNAVRDREAAKRGDLEAKLRTELTKRLG